MIDAAAFAALCAPVPTVQFIELLLRTGFSPRAYLDAYGDLRERNWDETQGLLHFIRFGLAERRVAPMILQHDALLELARLPMHRSDFQADLLASFAQHLFDGMQHPYGETIAQRWDTVRSLIQHGARPYFVTGDSHSQQFYHRVSRGPEWLLPIPMLCTGGSASGLNNPRSRSGYGGLLRQAVKVIGALPDTRRVPFILQFGQVDVEFVYHFRRARAQERTLDLDHYRTFSAEVAEAYMGFVSELFEPAVRSRVRLAAIFPPALSDAVWKAGYVNDDIAWNDGIDSMPDLSEGIRALEIASLRQRTEIHRFFNDIVAAACRRQGFGFIDSFNPFLGVDGLVNDNYVIQRGADHHLRGDATNATLCALTWECADAAVQRAPAPVPAPERPRPAGSFGKLRAWVRTVLSRR